MALSTYVAVGNKEDISDIISNISPKDTPFFSACGKVTATATYHEWLEDTLRNPAANKQLEGAEYVTADPAVRTRKGNYTQIFSAGYGVTGTQEVVAKHGVSSEIGDAMVKAMKEISLDIEYALMTQTAKSAGGASTARQFGGVPFWIGTNVVAGGGLVPTEGKLNEAIQLAWAEGGNPTKVYLSGTQKRNVSAWSGEGEKYLDQNSKKLVNSIAVYESDFGVVSFVPHRLLPDTAMYVIDPSLWKIGQLRKLKTETLPKTGDHIKKIIIGELTLEARSEKGNAKITGLVAVNPEPDPEE
ncbi:MAG: DUF5309 domain-containing protein [Synergistaceae bacterium]|nr:DUF5309 domain-containing protein [Synergistaceae bacterium]